MNIQKTWPRYQGTNTWQENSPFPKYAGRIPWLPLNTTTPLPASNDFEDCLPNKCPNCKFKCPSAKEHWLEKTKLSGIKPKER